jgi:hypothetical protein
MRHRIVAAFGSAALLAAGLAAAGPVQAVPAFDSPWTLCASASDSSCIVSATANGGATFPGQVPSDTSPRDYPWVSQVDGNLIDFGVWHDDGSHNSTNVVDPTVTYTLVVRTGTFMPREMDAVARNGSYSIGSDATGYTFTVTFQPTAVHRTDKISCTYDGGCGDNTTAATSDQTGFATGAVQTLDPSVSGLDPVEVAERTGMYTFTNAQDSYVYYDNDLNVLEVRLANPHLETDGTTPVTDGSYDGFVPDAYLTGVMGVPDPTVLGGFTVTRTVGGVTVPASASMTHVSGGVVFHLSGISFSRPQYRLKPLPTPPGRPRGVIAVKTGRHTAKVRFARPLLNGGRAIGYYQGRCRHFGGVWHYARRSASPVYFTALPVGRVWCQVRAHNVKGYGKWSALVHS